MNFAKRIALIVCIMIIGATATFAGINSKEVGAVLIYPEYWATNPCEKDAPICSAADTDTYFTVTNDKSSPVIAHIEIVGGEACDDCNFDLELTGYQTKRLWLDRRNVGGGYTTVILDASPHTITGTPVILTACPEKHGFIVVTLEAAGPDGRPANPRVTLGENMLHGDEVVLNLTDGYATQVGAIAIQGAGPNNGDRNLAFNNMEYTAFPSIVTGNFWSPNNYVNPRLILFNANFTTGIPPETWCSINYVDAEENVFSKDFHFGCWADARLVDIAPGFHENILGTANGFLWAQCGAGTHGAIQTKLSSFAGPNYVYPDAAFKDTLFQSITTNPAAVLSLTPSITGTP